MFYFRWNLGLFMMALLMAAFGSPLLAQPADSDVCVMDRHVPGVGKRYFQHNKVIIGNYRELVNTFGIAEMRGAAGAPETLLRMKQALDASPELDRRPFSIVTEPPTFVDFNRSCDRIPNPPVAGEYPIIFNTISPRVVGEMCADEPEIKFEINRNHPNSAHLPRLDMEDFYDPALSAEVPLTYSELEERANRGDVLAAVIRGIMGIRLMQCENMHASMKLIAVRENLPIMSASVLLLDDGIQVLPRDDSTGRRLAEGQGRAREQLQARLARSEDWEQRAAVGAAIVITGLAIMMMSRCNDDGYLGNINLPNCE